MKNMRRNSLGRFLYPEWTHKTSVDKITSLINPNQIITLYNPFAPLWLSYINIQLLWKMNDHILHAFSSVSISAASVIISSGLSWSGHSNVLVGSVWLIALPMICFCHSRGLAHFNLYRPSGASLSHTQHKLCLEVPLLTTASQLKVFHCIFVNELPSFS